MNWEQAANEMERLAAALREHQPVGRLKVGLNVYDLHTRIDIASWVRIVDNAKAWAYNGSHGVDCKHGKAEVHLYYQGGLLAPAAKTKIVVMEHDPDLDGLKKEFNIPEKTVDTPTASV